MPKLHAVYCLFVLLINTHLYGQSYDTPLFIPPILEGPTYNLSMDIYNTKAFIDGQTTTTYGINGNYLGPTLILNVGDNIQMNVTNNIGETTTMHWHGMHVAPENDGGPHTSFEAGSTWSPSFEVIEKACTMWYHPHLHEHTAQQVYNGLAGMIIIRDEEEAALNLPRTYGVDDIPFIIQNKAFDANGQLVFPGNGMQGGVDSTMVINGSVYAYHDCPAQLVRFRALNASVDRTYNIGLSDHSAFYQISSDGGLLTSPVNLNRIMLAPGERAEFVVDCSAYSIGTELFLMSYASELGMGITGGATGGGGGPFNPLNGANFNLLALHIVSPIATGVTNLPTTLTTISPWNEADATVTRPMLLDGGGPGVPFTINGVEMDMNIINETVNLGDIEIWEITNESNIAHPFHIHDIQFYILDRNGVAPNANEQGRKDVVFVLPNETVRFIGKFDDFANSDIPYMYHCHILTHEDGGMMGQFIVVDDNINTCSTLQANLFLEGPYDIGNQTMRTDLAIGNLLSLSQPFNTAPWNYLGSESIDNSLNGFNNLVDWILIELRDSNDPNTIITQQAGLLRFDGALLDSDGSVGLCITEAVADSSYYVVVRHSNHLDIMSATAISLNNSIDFSIPAMVSGGTNQLSLLPNNTAAMIAGDFDADGIITFDDFNRYLTQIGLSNYGGDANLNGTSNGNDFGLYRKNSIKIGLDAIRY